MTMLPTVDSGTLGWVRSEIEGAILEARNTLQQYEADPSDPSIVKTCATHLHQVYGALTMVELDGAARLMQESANLAQRLSDGSISWGDECGVVLREALDELSGYLKGLQAEPVPSPLQLLDSINRLLEIQHGGAVTELELFRPDLSARPREVDSRIEIPGDVLHKPADDLRPRFERALLAWLKDAGDRPALHEFARMFESLVHADRRGAARQLWWIAAALSKGLLDGSIETSDEIRAIMARIDEQLRRLCHPSQSLERRAAPEELTRRILLILARCSSHDPLVREVRQSFGLDEWVARDHHADASDADSSDAGSLSAFGSEAAPELEQAQRLLARYFSPQGRSREVLGEFRDCLESLSAAARRNNLDVIDRLLTALLEATVALGRNAVGDFDQAAARVAAVLLFIRDSVGGQVRAGAEWHRHAETGIDMLTRIAADDGGKGLGAESDVPETDLPLPVVQAPSEVTRVVAGEIRNELRSVEHGLERVAGGGALSGFDESLRRIVGAFVMLEQENAAGLAEKLRGRIDEFAARAAPVDHGTLDGMAVAVGALSAYAAALEVDGDPLAFGDSIRRAEEELAGAGAERVEPSADSGESPPVVGAAEADAARIAADVAEPQRIEPSADSEGPPPVVDDAGGDDEVARLFFDEARELGAALAEQRVEWRENPRDREPLAAMRRCFHTLKGSGRFAGATGIAELSEVVEGLLNKVLGDALEAGEEVRDFVDRACAELTSLIAAREPRAPVEVARWRREAETLSARADVLEFELPDVEGELDFDVEDFDVEDAGPAMPPLAVVEDAAPGLPTAPVEAVSGSVAEIYLKELESHVAAIADSIAEARERLPDWTISAELLRAAHTLKGASRSVGLEVIAEMSAALDELLNFHLENSGGFEMVDLVLIDQSCRTLRYGAGRIDGDLRLPGDVAMQFRELARAFRERLRFLRVGEAPLPEAASATDESARLIEVFCEEALEILARVDADVQQWKQGRDASSAISALRRELHTLKGGARTVGWTALGDLGHGVETLLEDESMVIAHSRQVLPLVEEAHDLAVLTASSSEQDMRDDLLGLARRISLFEPVVEPVAELVVEPAVEAAVESVSESVREVEEEAPPPVPEVAEDVAGVAEAIDDGVSAEAGPPAEDDVETRAVRVGIDALDELISYSGEVTILRTLLQQQVGTLKSHLSELNEVVRFFRDQLRDLEIEADAQMLANRERFREDEDVEFDPLELDRFGRMQTVTRNLNESLANLISAQAGIVESTGDAEGTLQRQAQAGDALQERLLRTRMVSFASIAPRLRYLAHQTARELAKEVQVDIIGQRVEMDRKVMDQLSVSCEHMIRNAVVHGIEDPGARRARNKPSHGSIRISVEQEGSDVVVEVSDDGQGIDVGSIEREARARGTFTGGEMAGDDLVRLLSTPGLSTSAQVTQVSGRGVGMDVVGEMVRRLGGALSISTESGKGTTFTLRVPVTLAVSHALMVHAGGQTFALPARIVVRVLRVPSARVGAGDDNADSYVHHGERRIPVLNLANRLGLPYRAPQGDHVHVVAVRAGLREVGLEVEAATDIREVLVKPLGSLLESVPGIGAATILGDGSIVLILDAAGLWQSRHVEMGVDAYPGAGGGEDVATVMVVDDSMTVRHVMDRDLQNHGYQVMLARDGVDAIEMLRRTVPDVLLVDIEMPRMNGFELTERVRSDGNLRQIPILMITSRSGVRHRERALKLGANGYMTKPYNPGELIKTIDELIGARPTSTLH